MVAQKIPHLYDYTYFFWSNAKTELTAGLKPTVSRSKIEPGGHTRGYEHWKDKRVYRYIDELIGRTTVSYRPYKTEYIHR